MAFRFASVAASSSPETLRMHLVRCISSFSTDMHHVHSVFVPPALSLAPYHAAEQLVRGESPVRFAIPGPNDAYFRLETRGVELHLEVELRCRLQAPQAQGVSRKRARQAEDEA